MQGGVGVRILVVSDTHGQLGPLRSLVGRVGVVDFLLHAGDHYDDRIPVGALFGLPPERCIGVVGNCDYPLREPDEVVWEQEGVRILLTHGHRHDVKRTLMPIWYRAREQGCRVAIFGHSHLPVQVQEGEVLLFNPGSPAQPRRQSRATIGILELKNGRVTARHLGIDSF